MTVIAQVVLSHTTKEQYDDIRAKVGHLDDAPVGGILHLTWWEGNDCHNLDAWESEDDLNRFAATRLGPALAAAGVTSEPVITLHVAHEVFVPRAATITG